MKTKKMTAEEKAAKKAALEDMIAEGIQIKTGIIAEPEYTDEDLDALEWCREFGL